MPLQTSEERSLFILVVQRRTSLDQRVARWAQTKSQSMTPAPGMEEANAVGDATAKFLLETLVRKQTIHHRNQASYVSLRTWRRPIKAYQIEALDALKAHSPHALAKTVALEVAESVRGIFGAEGLRNVVPVPCGSSRKSDCLSVLIAQDLARLLGIRFCNILVPGITKAGKSHPKKSAQLQPYTLSGRISGPTLVVDDVSTSGRHMELAFEALRKAGTPVVGTTWIGS